MAQEGEQFQNEPSRRMYYFLNEIKGQKGIKDTEIFKAFGKYESNPRNYYNALLNGRISVKLEEILKAQEHFDLDPCQLFERPKNTFRNAFAAENILVEERETIYKTSVNIIAEKDEQIRDLKATIKSHQATIQHLLSERKQK